MIYAQKYLEKIERGFMFYLVAKFAPPDKIAAIRTRKNFDQISDLIGSLHCEVHPISESLAENIKLTRSQLKDYLSYLESKIGSIFSAD